MNKLKIINKFIATTFIVTCFMSSALTTANVAASRRGATEPQINNDFFADFAKKGYKGKKWNNDGDLEQEFEDKNDFFDMIYENYELDDSLYALIEKDPTKAAPTSDIINGEEDYNTILNLQNTIEKFLNGFKLKKNSYNKMNALVDNLIKILPTAAEEED